MIVTVSMNPAIDKTVEIPCLQPGGFMGGNAGKTIENVLDEKQIRHDFIWVEGETRTNTKVFETNGAVTELNEPGSVIQKEQVGALMDKLSGYAAEDTLFILAGSIPGSVDKDIYAKITRMAHEKGAKVFMDADGGAVLQGACRRPGYD